ncbi:MAG: hypothetical protein ACXWJB_09125 [Limisphaerales bacterium]
MRGITACGDLYVANIVANGMRVGWQFFVVCAFTAMLTASAADSSYVLPNEVASKTEQQLKSYLGTNNFVGVPLLDRSVNWEYFTNWPDEFQFQKTKYKLRLVGSESDMMWDIDSRKKTKGIDFLVRYVPIATNDPYVLDIACAWRPDGSVEEKGVSELWPKDHKGVFTHQFTPDHKLYLFSYTEFETGAYCLKYYQPDGRMIGQGMHPRDLKLPRSFEWNGRSVAYDEFNRLSLEFMKRIWQRTTRTGVQPKNDK